MASEERTAAKAKTPEMEAEEGAQRLAWQVTAYYRALRSKALPEPLIHSLVLDYHRAMIAPKDRGYTLEYTDYHEYLDAWERKTFGRLVGLVNGATDGN